MELHTRGETEVIKIGRWNIHHYGLWIMSQCYITLLLQLEFEDFVFIHILKEILSDDFPGLQKNSKLQMQNFTFTQFSFIIFINKNEII